MRIEVLGFVNLLCSGLLAGEEFVVRYGIRGPVASIDPQPQIQLRQALTLETGIIAPVALQFPIIDMHNDIDNAIQKITIM